MQKYITFVLFILMFTISFTSSAQWGKQHGRYSNRYYSSPRYYPRTSVSVIARLPFGAISLSFGNRYYHYYNGSYYRPYNHGYMMVPPPVGIIVPTLPIGYTHVYIGSNPYYRYGDVFYAPYGDRYRVVEQPEENESSSASNDRSDNGEFEKVILEGKTYYKKGDKYYKASVSKDGEIRYEEVGEISKSK